MPSESPPAAPDRPLAGITLLAVEDSRFASEALRLLCHRLGARLRRAGSLAEAAHHLARPLPDLVLVDLGLPDGSGTSLIARLAATATPVLGMSGEDGAEALARRAGASGFIAKPLESIASFRDTVLAHLPGRTPPQTARLPAAVLPPPDPLALREDLAHAAARLAAGDAAYVVGFVAGLARSTRDPALERAARGAGADLGPLLQDRLSRLSATGPLAMP
jgi:CheY-like chemotaxis protein